MSGSNKILSISQTLKQILARYTHTADSKSHSSILHHLSFMTQNRTVHTLEIRILRKRIHFVYKTLLFFKWLKFNFVIVPQQLPTRRHNERKKSVMLFDLLIYNANTIVQQHKTKKKNKEGTYRCCYGISIDPRSNCNSIAILIAGSTWSAWNSFWTTSIDRANVLANVRQVGQTRNKYDSLIVHNIKILVTVLNRWKNSFEYCETQLLL